MSLLEKLCEELGVKVGEEWLGSDGKTYIIENEAIIEYYEPESYSSTDYESWVVSGCEVYANILQEKLKPVWKPSEGDIVYYPNITCMSKDKVDIDTYEPNSRDVKWWNYMIDNNLVFKTKEEAMEMANKMLKLAKEER